MSFDFGAIDPERSIVFLPFDGSFRQDVGANLVVDGDMEDPTPAAYSEVNSASLSKIASGAYEGSQYLSIGYGGVPTPGARQTVLTAGYMYSYEVALSMLSGSGSANFNFGTGTIENTSSNPWQFFQGVAAGSTVVDVLVIGGTGTARADAMVVREYPQVCRSLSKQVGVLNYARMGDGHTSTTFPTQRGGRGLSFDSNDYVNLDWVSGGALDTTTFTFLCYAKPVAPAALTMRMYEIGVNGGRYVFYWDAATSSLQFLRDGAIDVSLASTEAFPDGSDHVYAVAISSVGCKMYLDGTVVASISGDIRLPSFSASSLAMIGTYPVSPGTLAFVGDMYSVAIYPFELSTAQVREWGRRARQMRSI